MNNLARVSGNEHTKNLLGVSVDDGYTSIGDMNECSGLSSGAVNRQWDVQRCLHEKSVQNLGEEYVLVEYNMCIRAN